MKPYIIGGTGGFRFDGSQGRHEYTDVETGVILPSITQMLEATGHVDTTWLTQEGRERGTAVHELTAAYDLQAITNLDGVISPYKAFLLAHVQAVTILRPTILSVEEPSVSQRYGFGGRPDRVVKLNGIVGVYEIKSGQPEKSHAYQCALQAILVSEETGIPPELLGRWCCYVKADGKFKIVQHTRRADFDVARAIVKQCCG